MSSPTIPEGTEDDIAADAVRALEKDLSNLGARRWLRRALIVLALAGVGAGIFFARRATQGPPAARFVTQPIQKRDVVEQVQSTGKVKPLTEVQVGAQVSGRVVKVLADFNSAVKKGDLLAEIDPQLLGAAVSQASAQLDAARANVERSEAALATAKTTLDRAVALRAENLTSAADVDQARGNHDVARAEVAAAKAQLGNLTAQLSSARTTLKYTRIYSPIDGVVINRAVEPGQTVAASFSAPVLFVIAQDLSKMQVLADIDEADVGKLEESMVADVVVDAFPGDVFHGKVSQVRYSPNELQGVVTYSAVVDVENPELKLRPGMTATVSVATKRATQVAALPNAALRFRPAPVTEEQRGGFGGPEPPPAPVVQDLPHGKGRVFLVSDGPAGLPGTEEASEQIVDVGITDGVWTELKGGLPPGTDVITEQRDSKKKGKFLGLF